MKLALEDIDEEMIINGELLNNILEDLQKFASRITEESS